MVQGNAGAINTRRYDVGLNLLAFELDVWGRVASLSEAARLNFEASAEDRRTIRLGLISDVANAYYAQLEAQQRLGLLTQSEQSREQVLSLTQRKREVGAASDLDVALARGAWLNTRAETVAMRRQAEQAGTALALLVGGQLPGTLPAGLPLGLQSMNLRWDRNLPSDVLLQRPDVRAAEARLMAAHANIQAARVAFLPRLQLTGLLGSASPAFNNLMGGGSSAWSFVPSLQLPILTAGDWTPGSTWPRRARTSGWWVTKKPCSKPFARWPTCWSRVTPCASRSRPSKPPSRASASACA
jgi:multidrug efflux system outer membrane protein